MQQHTEPTIPTVRCTEKPKLSAGQLLPQTSAANLTRKRYGDVSGFLSTFNKDIQPLIASNTERAYLGTAPTLTVVAQAYNSNTLMVWIMAQLENLNDFAGVKQKMNLQQMEELARMIAVDYHYLKVTEFHLFLYRMKGGRYGQFFGNIDPMVIMESLTKFASERLSEISTFERKRQNAHINALRELWQSTGITRHEYETLKNKSITNK